MYHFIIDTIHTPTGHKIRVISCLSSKIARHMYTLYLTELLFCTVWGECFFPADDTYSCTIRFFLPIISPDHNSPVRPTPEIWYTRVPLDRGTPSIIRSRMLHGARKLNWYICRCRRKSALINQVKYECGANTIIACMSTNKGNGYWYLLLTDTPKLKIISG